MDLKKYEENKSYSALGRDGWCLSACPYQNRVAELSVGQLCLPSIERQQKRK